MSRKPIDECWIKEGINIAGFPTTGNAFSFHSQSHSSFRAITYRPFEAEVSSQKLQYFTVCKVQSYNLQQTRPQSIRDPRPARSLVRTCSSYTLKSATLLFSICSESQRLFPRFGHQGRIMKSRFTRVLVVLMSIRNGISNTLSIMLCRELHTTISPCALEPIMYTSADIRT